MFVWVVAFCLGALAYGQAVKDEYTLMVLSHQNQMLYDIDMSSGTILRELKLDSANDPHEAAISPDGNTIFVSIPDSTRVLAVDTRTFRQRAQIESEYFKRPPLKLANGRITTSANPHGLAVTEDGSKLYIGVEDAEIPGLVVYDLKAGKVMKKIDLLLRGGHYFAIQPSTGKLYYPHGLDNRVVVVDTKTDKLLKIVPIQPLEAHDGGGAHDGPVGVDFTPNGEVWIHSDGDGSVTVIDSKTDEVVKVIKTAGKGGGRIAVSPDGRFAASSHGESADTAIIDTAKKEVIATVKTGKGPSFPVFSPDGTKLFVMNSADNDVAVVDMPAMKVTARHKAGSVPFAGGIHITKKSRH
jgi:YVTN family beta-propeller protein